MGFLSRLFIPRSVRRAMHPGRAVKRAVTPKAVKGQVGHCILSTKRSTPWSALRQQPSDQVPRARLPFSGMEIVQFTIEVQKPQPNAGIHSRLHFPSVP